MIDVQRWIDVVGSRVVRDRLPEVCPPWNREGIDGLTRIEFDLDVRLFASVNDGDGLVVFCEAGVLHRKEVEVVIAVGCQTHPEELADSGRGRPIDVAVKLRRRLDA